MGQSRWLSYADECTDKVGKPWSSKKNELDWQLEDSQEQVLPIFEDFADLI